MTSHSSSATERGAVSRERRDSGSAHGSIVVRQTFLNLVSIYYNYNIIIINRNQYYFDAESISDKM